MEEAKTQSGLVGFFDILGYQSFLENNDAEIATSEVLNIINDIPNRVTGGLKDSLKILDEEMRSIEFEMLVQYPTRAKIERKLSGV